MPGYFLVEHQYLSPPKPEGQGITANARKIGFTDFLRELEFDDFPYNENTNLIVYGIEDVLLFARPDMEGMAKRIHKTLQHAASKFEKNNCPWIQIVFRYKLTKGKTLIVEMKPENQPVYLIFGFPVAQSDGKGNVFYTASFNLSSPQ